MFQPVSQINRLISLYKASMKSSKRINLKKVLNTRKTDPIKEGSREVCFTFLFLSVLRPTNGGP